MLSFMDTFSGYHHILLHPDNQEKTAFITDRDLYSYKVMPFGLKNTTATYQRLINKIFECLVGKQMEVYIDGMIIKSKADLEHPSILKETFDILQDYAMKLNPKKCIFRVHYANSWVL